MGWRHDENGPSRVIGAVMRSAMVWLVSMGVARAHDTIPPLSLALPDGVQVVATEQDDERLEVYLDDAGHRWSEAELEEVVRAALEDAFEAGLGVTGVIPWAARDGAWVPVPALLPALPPVPRKSFEVKVSGGDGGPVVKSLSVSAGARRRGGLAGKVVYVSAGHGFTWDPAVGRWVTQRGNTHDIVEDLVSAESIDQLLTTYLENAGATVFTVRERDMNPDMVIVDVEAGGVVNGGSYVETGAWQDSTSGGYKGGLAPLVEGENPFALGSSRVALVATQSNAVASWSFEVPVAGDYRVYAAWVAGENRAVDAHYVVRHAGGESHFRVNQRRHGGTWMSLGRFRFEADGVVELHNDSAVAGSYVSADAVRIGGGMGDADRGDGTVAPRAPTSGRPRWEEAARYHIQFTGAPQSVYRYASDERSDDVGARSRYAAWQNEVGEDAVYIAWHTNAPSPAVGTSTFVYGPNPPDGTYDFTGTVGSDKLGRFLHDEVANDFKAAVDPAWRNRGLYTAYFGEINKSHNPEMPSALCEVAFHATESDAAHLKNPKVRNIAARAFYQAVAKYFADRDGQDVTLLPEPPVAVRAVANGSTVTVSWAAAADDGVGGDAASGFRLYRSADGKAWDDGADVSGTSVEVGVPAGVPSFFRVSAFNDGGESMPSVVVAAMPTCDGGPKSLIVHGFYRLDAGLAPREDLSTYNLANVVRVRLDEMNRFDAIVPHAWALARAGVGFDAAEATAVPALGLGAYTFVDWVLGEESTVDETLSDAEQALIGAWLAPGKTLLVSGAELAWDLGSKGSATDQAFLAGLGASYVADDAGTYALTWAGGAMELDDGTRGMYDVNFPDVLAAEGADVILSYGDGAVAGVAKRGAGTSIVLGVPVEALFPEAARDTFVASLIAEAGLACEVGPDPEVEVVEVVAEVVEVGPEVEAGPEVAELVDAVEVDGVTIGRPGREVVGNVSEDGGCSSSSGAWSFVSLIVLAFRRRRA